MYTTDRNNRTIGLAVTTAMAGVLLAGCAGGSAPQASVSASEAQQAMASGKHQRAIKHAEAAVQAEPRNAEYRATLAQAYLDAGRFTSAVTSFNDAVELGDTSGKTALSLALALTGQGSLQEAQNVLRSSENDIADADLGLALALAGDAQGAISVMSNAIRGGNNTVKMRQNLAYAFAMGGRWREARLMAAQDVPADMLGARMEEWAAQANPQSYRTRLATLLDVPGDTVDNGQPIQLALGNSPSIDQLASHALDDGSSELAALDNVVSGDWAASPVAEAAPSSVTPPAALAEVTPAPVRTANRYASVPTDKPANFADAFAVPGPAVPATPRQDAGSYIAASTRIASAPAPVIASAPAARKAVRQSQPAAPVSASGDGTHLVQLGSFSSPQGAERAKAIYLRRYPELNGEQMVVTEAVVRGKRYWRVSAAGYERAESKQMCARVNSASNEGCITWAEGSPLPGAVDTGIRMARR